MLASTTTGSRPWMARAGRPIAEIAQPLGISAESIYTWRRQDRIDKGLLPGLSSRSGQTRTTPTTGGLGRTLELDGRF